MWCLNSFFIILQNTTSTHSLHPCKGFLPAIPTPFLQNYPFQLHAFQPLPFTFTQFALHSDKCIRWVDDPGKTCEMCESLNGSKKVEDIVRRASTTSNYTNHRFLTFSQLEERLELLKEERTAVWFQKLCKVQNLTRSLDMYKKLVLSLSQNDVP